jgi:hypothetical protein
MTTHQEFLKFEAVLAHCETRVSDTSLTAAMEYGREMQFFDRTNRLSQSGQLLAELIVFSQKTGWLRSKPSFCILLLVKW